ncbi:hypothetical protein [Streptosporangium minutum]|nr:hypothetical protein [Streptosporangium minutum]
MRRSHTSPSRSQWRESVPLGLDAALRFKLGNRHLSPALEGAGSGMRST